MQCRLRTNVLLPSCPHTFPTNIPAGGINMIYLLCAWILLQPSHPISTCVPLHKVRVFIIMTMYYLGIRMQRNTKKLQRQFDLLNGIELALTPPECLELIEVLTKQLAEGFVRKKVIVIHFTATDSKVPSVACPDIKILRLETLIGVSLFNLLDGSYEVDLLEQERKIDNIKELIDNEFGE